MYAETPAGDSRSTLREEVPPNDGLLLLALVIHPLSPTAALHKELLDPGLADARESTLLDP